MICAVDPGKTGALAFLSPSILTVVDMPVVGKDVSGALLGELFGQFVPGHVYVEAVNSFGMGRQSAFKFGQGFGTILGAAAALAFPVTLVSPAKWKRAYGLGRDKDAARLLATRLFPKNASDFKRKKDDGRAEAALLALYIRDGGVKGVSEARPK
jgi:crossover junction endodeoxyribonuclease RuvC